jgi:hypothetical protein
MEEKIDNVIKFPKSSRIVPTQTSKQLEETFSNSISDIKIDHINESLYVLLPKLFHNIDMAGGSMAIAETDIKEEIKDINMIVESIRSLLYKRYELTHPFHKLTDAVFAFTEDGDININENVQVQLETLKNE